MLSLDDFSGRVGKDFEVPFSDGSLFLRLTAAEALPHGVREGGPFRLELLGPQHPVLPQAIYLLREGGRDFEIFIVPTASDAGGTRYEAIFT
jgi:hypothetical protein